ncbi:MAG: aminotransferase class IV [Candidatus Omnitrophica bacterium]|nr:aminotransferase class IV [Candidatus Omnitrophota bacterium]
MLQTRSYRPQANNLFFDLGDNVFESMRAYGGKIFCLEEHLERLETSAKSIQIKLPSCKELRKKILQEFSDSGLKEAYLRVSINFQGEINIIITSPPTYPKELYEKGVKVIIVPNFKDSVASVFPQAKTGNFLNGVLAKIEAKDYFEAILLNRQGYITEGTVSNIFIVKEKILVTPPLYLGVLPGITRKVVIELAEELEIKVKEIPFTRHELYNADEVFLTNTSLEILPVTYVDGRKIGDGCTRKITNFLRNKFLARRLG